MPTAAECLWHDCPATCDEHTRVPASDSCACRYGSRREAAAPDLRPPCTQAPPCDQNDPCGTCAGPVVGPAMYMRQDTHDAIVEALADDTARVNVLRSYTNGVLDAPRHE